MRPPIRYANGDRDHRADEHPPEHDGGSDASMPFTKSGPNPHANTASATANSGRPARVGAARSCRDANRPVRTLTARQIRGYVLAMIEIPEGTRVYGIQLPIQSKSKTFVADWELSADPADLARGRRATADEHGYFYVAVCDHIAIPESLGSTMGTYWQDCITTLSWLGAQTERTALAVARVRAPLPPPARRGQGVRDPRLPHRWPRHRRDRRRSRGGRVRGARRRPRAARQARRGEAPAADRGARARVGRTGSARRPVRCRRRARPVWIAGSSPAAIRRAATYGDGWLPQGPSNAEMVAKLQAMRDEHGASRSAHDDRRHHAVPLRRARRAGTSARARSAARPATSPSRSWPTPPRV